MAVREHVRALLRLSRDEGLVAGIGGAVSHFAARAGLDDAACASLAAVLEDFCRQTLPLIESDGEMLDVAIEDFEDRVEIAVEHRGQAYPSVGFETFVEAAAGQSPGFLAGVELMRTVDRVVYDAENENIRTTLVKYLKP